MQEKTGCDGSAHQKASHVASPGFAELLGVAGSVLVPPASEPGLDLPLGEPALRPQAHQLSLQTHKHIGAHAHAASPLRLMEPEAREAVRAERWPRK